MTIFFVSCAILCLVMMFNRVSRFVCFSVFVMCGVCGDGMSKDRPAKVDFDGFVALSQKIQPIRERRLVHWNEFRKMSAEENTIILDTRSKKAFDAVHLKGAVHLNFSDFTEEKLAKLIPDKGTRILIYCNNNFDVTVSELKGALSLELDRSVIANKALPLALNIPTFVNLYGYGYENVYELRDYLRVDDPRIELVGDSVTR